MSKPASRLQEELEARGAEPIWSAAKGKPKPVRFPDPSSAAVQVDDLKLLPLPRLLELKLASGLSAPHRLRDLTDALELIRHAGLPSFLAESLDASVRGKYLELWQAAQAHDPE